MAALMITNQDAKTSKISMARTRPLKALQGHSMLMYRLMVFLISLFLVGGELQRFDNSMRAMIVFLKPLAS